jgi:reactive intermediate/imine deaminase
MHKSIISTEHAPRALGAYSQGVRTGDFLYTSGQIGIDPVSMQLVEGIEHQIRQTFLNIQAICEAEGADLSQIIKLTVLLVEQDSWPLVNKVMQEMFSGSYPARTAFGVAWLPLGAAIEVEAVVRLD